MEGKFAAVTGRSPGNGCLYHHQDGLYLGQDAVGIKGVEFFTKGCNRFKGQKVNCILFS